MTEVGVTIPPPVEVERNVSLARSHSSISSGRKSRKSYNVLGHVTPTVDRRVIGGVLPWHEPIPTSEHVKVGERGLTCRQFKELVRFIKRLTRALGSE